jgi:hypothetical protein
VVPEQQSSGALRAAAVLIAGEAVAALAFGALAAAGIHRNRIVVGAGTALLMLGYGALLAAAARGVWRGRRWSRAPVVAAQLIQIPVAWSFAGGQTTWLALLLAGVSIAILVCVLLPSSTAIFAASNSKAAPER